jgi:hypothetical protein
MRSRTDRHDFKWSEKPLPMAHRPTTRICRVQLSYDELRELVHNSIHANDSKVKLQTLIYKTQLIMPQHSHYNVKERLIS